MAYILVIFGPSKLSLATTSFKPNPAGAELGPAQLVFKTYASNKLPISVLVQLSVAQDIAQIIIEIALPTLSFRR